MGIDLSWVSGRRILVVDDDEATLKLITGYLQRSMPNSEVRQASDGLEAWEQMGKWDPHILFTDINMPNMDGLELLMRIRLDYPQTQVIIFTARDDAEAANHALTHGAQEYIHKPLEMQDLLLACKRTVDNLELIEGRK